MSQHTKERTEELGGFAEHEVRNAYPCGCVAVVCQCGCGNPPEIIECSLHAQAPAMREALMKARDTFRDTEKAMALLGRPIVAEAMRIAGDGCHAVLSAIEGA